MPYIDKTRRAELFYAPKPEGPGELNYMITSLVVDYYDSRNFDYQVINDIIGALEGAKLEFYRRIAAPYEDRKRDENGEVY